jgi:hypothetical protein
MTTRGGFALPAAIAVLVLLSVLVVTVYANAMASFRSGSIDLGKSRSHFAAEAGAESGMAQLADALEDAVLEDAELTTITSPVMAGFTFDSFSVVKVGGVIPERITDGPFTGLWSLTQMVDVYSEASDPSNHSSAVMVTAKAQAIPIFQFGVFYEHDLEIHNGPRLDFAGWVHSNGNIYLNSANQYFQDLVTTPNKVFHDRKDSHAFNNGVWIQDATATDVRLTFDSRDTPDPNTFRANSNTDFDNRLQTDAYGVDSLRVPLPTGMDAVAVIEERLLSDGTLETQAKMAHKSDWYIEVPVDQIAAENQLCAEMIQIRDDPTKVLPNAATCAGIFTLQYNEWWDERQNIQVDVLNVNLAALFAWSGVDATRITNILYIYFTGYTPGTDYPIVRVRNGSTLLNPITIATKHPMYVQGNYNTVGWQPSALIGDAMTLLSNSWQDTDHDNPNESARNASNTSYYAAILAGHSPTPCDHEVAPCGATSPYGGGLENYLRFLENWGGGRTAFYRGSLVSLHFTQQAPEGSWGGSYYNPPTRDWAFDTRFEDPANLPPGTPVVGNVIHTAYRPIF